MEKNKCKTKIVINLTNLRSSLHCEALIILQFHFRVDIPRGFPSFSHLFRLLPLQDFQITQQYMWCPTTFMNKYIYINILIYKKQMNELKLC